MRFLKNTACLCLLLCTALFSCAQSREAGKIQQLLEQYNQYKLFNGTALVAKNGQVIFKKGIGYANFEWNEPNAPDVKFRLGSITKQFTAMLILQLAEQGKLQLNGHISDYLPYYPKENGEKITIYNLLTHSAGIPNYTALPDFFERYARNPNSPRDFIPFFAELPLEFTPGSEYKYSNSGYFVLGAVIEAITGQPYAAVLQKQILTPLHMNSSGYDLARPIIKKRAAGYEKAGDEYVNAPYLDMSLPYAAGAMYSTVEDLYLWDQALYTNQLLSAAGKTTYFTPYLDGYACGWVCKPYKLGSTTDTVSALSHDGGINGFNTLIVRIPESKDLIVLLNNTGGAPLREMAQRILAILYNKPYDAPKKPGPAAAPATASQTPVAAPDTATYHTYTGRYQLAPGFFIEITAANGHIYEQATGQQRFEIFPEGPGKFFLKVVDAHITFDRNEAGAVTGMVLHQNGRDVPGKKTE